MKLELYDGTSWTETNDLNTGRLGLMLLAGASNTSAIVFGGYVGPPNTAATETWNGTNWTEVNSI